MSETNSIAPSEPRLAPRQSETGAEVNAVSEWRCPLAAACGGLLFFTAITGLMIYLAGFSAFNQVGVLLHTSVGLAMLGPVAGYLVRHWWLRRRGSLNHFQLLGYCALVLLVVCAVSGLVETWQGVAGPRVGSAWRLVHLLSGIAATLLLPMHLATVIRRRVAKTEALRLLQQARRVFFWRSGALATGLLVLCGLWAALLPGAANPYQAFPGDYSWRFGEDRPFAPSMARIDQAQLTKQVAEQALQIPGLASHAGLVAALDEGRQLGAGLLPRLRQAAADLNSEQQRQLEVVLAGAAQEIKARGAIAAPALAGSADCGREGCHRQIYEEWLPSAHRYSALDDLFQQVQTMMAEETSPEQTRYCAGCHDPISLFSGAKNSGNITLGSVGTDEGSSCIVCHSIVQTDVQGNGDYTISPPRPYLYESQTGIGRLLGDFLIRAYPNQHVAAYSRPLYRTPEFCGACHKQYIDTEVNTDIGKVQGQNQYDSWKTSRWYHEDEPQRTISCRECHMPLQTSSDPARGDLNDGKRSPDDGKHRSHRFLGGNQYVPMLHQLAGAEQHVALTEEWLRGLTEIPEIADRWTSGPVIRMEIVAPEVVVPGEELKLQVILTNNKTGHDFPTGPLDMLESWLEVKVTGSTGELLYHSGGIDEQDRILDTQLWYKADGFDRQGRLIDHHNLWDMVGASYKRALYPGMTDSVELRVQCPSMARDQVAAGRRSEQHVLPVPAAGDELQARAILWYRKANPEFLSQVYGTDQETRSPITEMTRAEVTIKVAPDS